MERAELLNYTNTLLCSDRITDYCPNGLQIEGSSTIHKIASGVTASWQLIDCAIEYGADTVLTHHGYFWKNENPCLVGMKGNRIRQLFKHDINLITYHLPLDLHSIYGNNALWGQAMGWEGTPSAVEPLIYIHQLESPIDIGELKRRLCECLNRSPLHLNGGHKEISCIAWCSGGAQDFIEKAAELGADAFLSGEVSEKTTHSARELGIDYFACGHHATEIFGVRALGEHVSQKFSLEHKFFNIHNPV